MVEQKIRVLTPENGVAKFFGDVTTITNLDSAPAGFSYADQNATNNPTGKAVLVQTVNATFGGGPYTMQTLHVEGTGGVYVRTSWYYSWTGWSTPSIPTPVTLTDAATIATNAARSNLFRVTITGDRTLGAPTNPTDGQKVVWEVLASGGVRTLTLATNITGAFKFGTNITTINPIASATTTFIGAVYRSSSDRWHVLAVSEGH